MKDNTRKALLEIMILLAMLTAVLLAGWQDFQHEDMGNEEKVSDNTVLFASGFPSIDAWMDFTDNEKTKEEYGSDTPQTAQQDTQHGQAARNEYFSDVSQCLWGKWVVTEKWVNNIYGWDANVEDEWIGTSIELRPENFCFEDQGDETVYYAAVNAVEDPWSNYYEIGIYWELGIRSDYYFEFEFKPGHRPGEIFVRNFILVSDNEMVIPVSRYTAYKLEKTENFDEKEGDGSFKVDGLSYDICYGKWEAVNIIRTNGTLDVSTCIEEHLILTRREDMDLTWRVLGRSNETVDRFARMIGLGENNEYLICYNLPKDCFWEQMFLIDDMTAILAKGDNLFLARRISDPIEDRIYWRLL